MAIVKCGKGHFYDNSKFSQCPYCGIKVPDEDVTISLALQEGRNDDKTVALKPDTQTKEQANDIKDQVDQDDKTVRFYEEQKGVDLIVGWLVCVSGMERGRDYRLHQGFNRIGRDYKMDIPVMDDKSLGREAVCAVVYDDRTNKFFAVQQQGNLAYLNGEILQGAVEIKTGDLISAGKSLFEFVAFCREGRIWEDE